MSKPEVDPKTEKAPTKTKQIKRGTKRNAKKTKKSNGGSHWTGRHKLKFTWFVFLFGELFSTVKERRRKERIFKLMAKFIGDKTSTQCRTHSQKKWKF